jgi:hypothetical protein
MKEQVHGALTKKMVCMTLAFCGSLLSAVAVTPLPAMASEWIDSTPAVRGDSVQSVLWRLSVKSPELVSYIPETKRLYLTRMQRKWLSDQLIKQLQDAFHYDVSPICKRYGMMYLADWRALVSKSARESFWGTSYLCNRTFNYFGIWRLNKPWICETFGFCEILTRNDPAPADFVVFPNFEGSLWMFIHTIYNRHYLERLPDRGERVESAIEFERNYGTPYWHANFFGQRYAEYLSGAPYSAEDLIYTWSEHPTFNLCENCSRQTDREWIALVEQTAYRAGEAF